LDLTAYRAFTAALIASLETDPQVLGLIALGSMAERGRQPDRYSDHDFFVITESGAQERFRQDLSWLPDANRIVFSIRETAHGLKVMYDPGHLLEFAVFDRAELSEAKVNDYRVLLDHGEITPLIEGLAARPQEDAASPYSPMRDLLMVFSLLYVGVGRYHRGERLSAHVFVKHHLFHHLLRLLVKMIPAPDQKRLDDLDPFRRFESVYPALGAAIDEILLQEVPASALSLLNLTEQTIRPLMPDYPVRAAEVVRQYLERG